MKKGRVVAAMSGGVDSSVAAALLVEQGHEVVGVMARLWTEEAVGGVAYNRCCTPDQMADARRVAHLLDIPFYAVDLRAPFKREVVDPFVAAYARGLTPNPCLRCNRQIRFGRLLATALDMDAAYMATGHYARIGDTEPLQLLKGVDLQKDQSYFLSVLGQEALARTMFPVGEYTKAKVREMAAARGLPVARKSDSQDLCFVADGDYRRFIAAQVPEAVRPGPIVNRQGERLGTHKGLPFYTVGQRKGLGIGGAEPLYVVKIDAAENKLIVGPRDTLGRDWLEAREVNWVSGHPPGGSIRAGVKIRYRAPEMPATVMPLDAATVRVHFDAPLRDITPGQGAVFYHGDVCLGGGMIR